MANERRGAIENADSGSTGQSDDPAQNRADEDAWRAERARRIELLGVQRAIYAHGRPLDGDSLDEGLADDGAFSRKGSVDGNPFSGPGFVAGDDPGPEDGRTDVDPFSIEADPVEIASPRQDIRSIALRDPAARAALAAGRFWERVPVGAEVDGMLVEATIDLLYEHADGRLVAWLNLPEPLPSVDAIHPVDSRRRLDLAIAALEKGFGQTVARVEVVTPLGQLDEILVGNVQ